MGHERRANVGSEAWIHAVRDELRGLAERERFDFRHTAAGLSRAFLQERHDLRGCPENVIAGLERRFRVALPGDYRAFLAVMGHGGSMLFEDHDCDPALLGTLQIELHAALLDSEESIETGPGRFVIFARHGCEYWWIPTEQVDPPVIHWRDGDPAPDIAAPSFRELVARALQDARRRTELEPARRVEIRRDVTGALRVEIATERLAG